MFERILVATDGSVLSQKAIACAIELAAQHAAELVVVKVIPHYPKTYLEGASIYTSDASAHAEKQWHDDAQAELDTVKTQAVAKGVQAVTAIVKSDLVAEAIIGAAKKHNSDLIVMASHGRKGMQRLLLGSETQHVLTHSQLPVLVLR